MRSWLLFAAVLLTFVVFTPALEANDFVGAAPASEADPDLQDLIDRVERLEAQQVPDWVNRFTLSGDFRYRYVNIDDDSQKMVPGGNRKRNLNDIRARLFFKAMVNDEVDVGFGFTTGEDDARDSETILGDAWSTKDVGLDLAFADYHPNLANYCGYDVRFIGGKMRNPYWKTDETELIFDEDVRPEGVAVVFSNEYEAFTLFGTLGGFYVEENANGADTSMFAAQAGIMLPIAESEFTLAAGYYDFGNIEKSGYFNGTALNPGQGNTEQLPAGSGLYGEDFDILSVYGEYAFELVSNKIPIQFYGEYVNNTSASKHNTGFAVGANLGRTKEPNDWMIGYRYKKLKADAVVGGFTDNEFAGGGSDVKGHEFNGRYVIAQHWSVGLTYFINELDWVNSSDDEYKRFQFDLSFDF